ncbi:unnamed protein product [Leptidea sinapis]|uniref:Uncharacterized protein n=1 Tax=Leptidea sinapis TaxID=189913 RepID=A0A5E4QZA6_9NEOP|nr:unnamed protein product [Leptidea sinapis]
MHWIALVNTPNLSVTKNRTFSLEIGLRSFDIEKKYFKQLPAEKASRRVWHPVMWDDGQTEQHTDNPNII